jgi:hypothetical protein
MADATVTFGAKDLNLGSTIEKLKKELGATQGASRNAAKEFEMSFAKMAGAVAVGTAAFEAFKAAGTFGLSAVTSALSGIGSAFTKSIDAAAQMETLKTAFIPLLGSADAAQNRIEELAKFAASTPFELPEIAKASRTLETLTRGALATGDGLRLVGDIAAGTNQPFEEVATTIGRLYDGLQSGRPVGEAMQRLQELGAVSGETRTQIEELSKAGKNTEAWLVAEEALNRFNGSMQLQSGTWTGLLSTLSDNITNAYAKFGEPIIDKLKPYLQGIIASVEILTEKAGQLGKSFAENFIASEKSVNSFQTALNAISTGQLGAGFSLFWDTLKLQVAETANEIYRRLVAAFQSAGQFLGEIFSPSGALISTAISAFELLGKRVASGIQRDLATVFEALPYGLGESTALALNDIANKSNTAANNIEDNLKGAGGRIAEQFINAGKALPKSFEENYAKVPPLFNDLKGLQDQIKEKEAGIAAKIKEGTQNRAEANEEIKLTGTFAEKMATLEAAYKDAVDSGNTSIADRILKMRDTISATEEGKKLAEKEAEKKEEARRKEEESKELKRESLELDLKIAEALAGGNEEQAKALQYQKDFNGYLKQAQDAGMGDAAESFATAMARAAGSAKNIKEELSESAKLFKSIEEARAKDATDRGGRDAQRAQDAIGRGDFRGAERAAGRIAAREERQGRQAGEKQAAAAQSAKPFSQRMAEGAQSFRARFAKSDKPAADQPAAEAPKSLRDRMAEGTQAFRDRMAGEAAVDKPGRTGQTDTAAQGGDKSGGKSSLDTLVGDIKKLLEKIEPKLPVAALV